MGWRRERQRIREMGPWCEPQTSPGPELGCTKLSLKVQKRKREGKEGREGGDRGKEEKVYRL